MSTGDPDFGQAAKFYLGREPYLPEFFPAIAQAEGLSKDSFVLDLACGSGELAIGLAPYCGSVLAIDKSAEMLCLRPTVPANVSLLRADLNSDAIGIPRPVTLVTIGRAVHFLDGKKLMPLLTSVTEASSRILICGTVIADTTPWIAQFRQLRRSYGTRRIARQDIYGLRFFAGSEWSESRRIAVRGSIAYGTEKLLQHALSFSSCTNSILQRETEFREKLAELMEPHCKAPGLVEADMVSWAVEYRHSRSAKP